ncbi:hypothetical protein SNE40_021268 [Patella caerulea]|uniref:Serine/threonine-protein phosphatase 2A regulatory subunit B'' subunit alpha/beta/delta EF-hand domain-containing protein n=1 Tax=Patella caerulea TaxID=87958 RepID=A0AAN8G7Q5_PATCE
MQTKYACIKYVHSRVTLYHTCKIDIRWKRSIHNCVLCDSMQFKKIGAECNCVHYGICSAVSLPIPLPGATRKKKIQVRKIPVNVPARKAPVGLPIKTPVDHPVKSPVNNPVCLPVAVNSPNRTLIAVNNLNQSAVGINNPHHTAIGVNIQIKTPVKVQIKTPVMAPENTLVSLPMRSPINLPVRTSIDVQDSPQMDVSVRTPDNISVKTSDNNSVRPSDNVSLRTSDNALLIMSDNSSRIQDNVPVNIPVQVFPSIQSKCLPPEQSVQLVLNNNKEKDCGVQDRKDREKKAEKDSQQNIIITNSKIEKENKTNIRELPIPKQNANIPKFYFPTGKPMPSTNSDLILQRVAAEFSKLDDGKAHKDQMGAIAKACGLPTFWKCPLFRATAGEEKGFITFESFSSMWKK